MQWHELEMLTEEFLRLEINKAINFDEFYRIAIVHHSSAIEGSTLTLEETSLLITEGITAAGKSMNEHHMVTDHYKALMFCMAEADKKIAVTPEFLKTINGKVNLNTGQIRNMALGICDDTKGDFRLGNVTAGNTYFVNYDKVVGLVNELCVSINSKIKSAKSLREIYELAFDAHFNLVSIHPWFDGNGRTSRLLMNFILAQFQQPLSIVFIEDKSQYITSLITARETKNNEVFRDFMCAQQIKFLKLEMEKFNKRDSGFTMML